MDFVAVVDQVITLLRQRGRLTYGTLKRQFQLDDAALEDLKEELMYGQRLAVDEDERMLVWMGETTVPTAPASGRTLALDTGQARVPLAGQVVAVVGEAGVGKSRLVYECLPSPCTQGWRVLESASVSYGKATPYFPVIDLLKRYAHVEDGDEPRTIRARVTGQVLTLDETLHETIPALLWLLDALPDNSPFRTLDPPQQRQFLLDALKRVLLRESQVQPLLLVFEDLHWIDTETQALLDRLVDSLPTARLLLLVNYRPEYQHSWGSKTYYTQLRLDLLPPARADEVLQALLGDDSSLAGLKPLLIAWTEGNPFFLEESVRALAETGVLGGERGAYRLAHALQNLQVPATVQAVLAARIDRLPAEAKHLLQTAAVIGTEVPLPLLQAIAEAPEESLHHSLAHLQATEFLYETCLFPEREYTFKHALTHEVAYGSLLLERRRALHALANLFLGASDWAQGEYGRAIDCLGETVGCLHGARRRERFGQATLPAVQARAFLAACHAELGRFAEGRILGEEGLQLAEEVAHPSSLMWACYGIGLLCLRQGNLPRALPLLARAMDICQEAGLSLFVPRMAAALGTTYTLSGRVAEAVALLTQAMEQTVATEMAGFQALCSLALGEAQVLADRLEEAHALAECTLTLAREYQERGHQAYALRLLGEIAARREPPEVELAATHYHQALALAAELGMRPLQAHCHRGLGTLHAATGQRQQAGAALATAIALYRDMEMTFWLPQAEAALAQVQ